MKTKEMRGEISPQQNYFLSGWIANFGVDPLLLFKAFLFWPDLTCFLDLFIFVTRVFETISQLLSNAFSQTQSYILKLERAFLPRNRFFVKIIIIFTFLPTSLHAEDKYAREIIMAIGEHRQLSIKKIDRFTIGNKDIISIKILKNKTFLIKGKKLGSSELIIWQQPGKQINIQVYVLSKNKHLKLVEALNTLKNNKLNASIEGQIILVDGEITSMKQYKLVKRLKDKYKKSIQFSNKLSTNIKSQIIGEIYKLFFEEYIDEVSCEVEKAKIKCFYPDSYSPSKEVLKNLSEKFLVQFVPISEKYNIKNYILKLKLIQIDKLNGEELDLGLSELSVSLKDLLNKGITDIISNNSVVLRQKNIQLSTIAQQQITLIPGKKSTIEVGSEIAFESSTTENGVRVNGQSWKFAGLRINLKLVKDGGSFYLKYLTKFSRLLDGSSIAGSKEESHIKIPLNSPTTLFQISYRTLGKSQRSFPYLSKIPLLGKLFLSKNSQATHKEITAIIHLREKNDLAQK